MFRSKRTPTAVNASDVRFYHTALGQFDRLHPGRIADNWTIANPIRGAFSAFEVSTTTRVWMFLRGCALFAEWVLSDPEDSGTRQDEYSTLSDWADREVAFKVCELQDDDSETVKTLFWGDAIVEDLQVRFIEEVLVPLGYSAEAITANVEVVRSLDRVSRQILSILGLVPPRYVLEALGSKALEVMAESDAVLDRRLALTVVNEHFGDWVDDDYDDLDDGEPLIEAVRERVGQLDDDEFAAMDLHGFDLALDLPDDVWLEIRAVLDEEAEMRASLVDALEFA